MLECPNIVWLLPEVAQSIKIRKVLKVRIIRITTLDNVVLVWLCDNLSNLQLLWPNYHGKFSESGFISA